jgi:hypothetical protein
VIEPAVVRHADWSTNPAKRWVATAQRRDDHYVVRSIQPVRDDLLDAGARPALIGLDLPIGLPLAYARAVGIDSFPQALVALGGTLLPKFFEIAGSAAEVSLERPFYPRSAGPKGSVRRSQLAEGLGLDFSDLLRRCEQPLPGRPAPSSLFWLVGSAQVGRAAIHGWRELLQPARRGGDGPALWPFDGNLEELVATRAVTVAEAYPAEFARQFGFGRGGWSKRRQRDRQLVGEGLLRWADTHAVLLDPSVRDLVSDGFGPRPDGEDAFDAFVGVLGLLRVVRGDEPTGPPLTADERSVEGWILGLTPP